MLEADGWNERGSYLSIYLDLLDWDETGNEWEMDAIDAVSFALSTERFVQRDVSCAMDGRKDFRISKIVRIGTLDVIVTSSQKNCCEAKACVEIKV